MKGIEDKVSIVNKVSQRHESEEQQMFLPTQIWPSINLEDKHDNTTAAADLTWAAQPTSFENLGAATLVNHVDHVDHVDHAVHVVHIQDMFS